VAGIDLAIDHSWVLIFLLVTFSLSRYFGSVDATWGTFERWMGALLSSVLFFASIVLHELGHSLTAQRRGIRVRSITLFIFGGVAQLASEPSRPRDEVVIALAGPAVSVTLGVVFLGLASLFPTPTAALGIAGSAFSWLGTINLVLAAFNAVPGFPLDGGRVLRGIVWAFTGDFERATRVAASSGSAFAITLMAFGGLIALLGGQLLSGLWLVLIGWFLLAAARVTVGQAVLERLLARVRIGDAMESVEESCLSGSETVAEAAAEVLRRGVRTFYVVDARGGLLGLVTLRELSSVAPHDRDVTRIHDVMMPAEQLAVVEADDNGWLAFQRMAERNVNQLPVVEDGRLRGAVTREQLLTLVQATLALGAPRTQPRLR
jgi:Zn-dependent protease